MATWWAYQENKLNECQTTRGYHLRTPHYSFWRFLKQLLIGFAKCLGHPRLVVGDNLLVSPSTRPPVRPGRLSSVRKLLHRLSDFSCSRQLVPVGEYVEEVKRHQYPSTTKCTKKSKKEIEVSTHSEVFSWENH